jgi:hypothetical protein
MVKTHRGPGQKWLPELGHLDKRRSEDQWLAGGGGIVSENLDFVREIVGELAKGRNPEEEATEEPKDREPEGIPPTHMGTLVGQDRHELRMIELLHGFLSDVDQGHPPSDRKRRTRKTAHDPHPSGIKSCDPGRSENSLMRADFANVEEGKLTLAKSPGSPPIPHRVEEPGPEQGVEELVEGRHEGLQHD